MQPIQAITEQNLFRELVHHQHLTVIRQDSASFPAVGLSIAFGGSILAQCVDHRGSEHCCLTVLRCATLYHTRTLQLSQVFMLHQ